MQPIEETVHINAQPALIWEMLVDVERWPEWTPSMKRVERVDTGPLAKGTSARLWIAGAMGPSVWSVTACEPGRSFTWESRIMPGVVTVADHEIVPNAGGATVALRVTMRGPLAPIAARLLDRVSRRNVRLEAEGLKRAAEARSAGNL